MTDREKVLTQLAGIGIGLDMAGYRDDAQCVRDALGLLREPARGWISVKDEMPMQIETVLFIGKNCHGDWFRAKRGYFDGTFWHSEDSGTIYSTTPVTHWMPLPEPPEEVNWND